MVLDVRGPTMPTSLPTCLLLTHVALCQRVRSVVARTRYINVLTYLLTYISSTIGCANFGPDWPLLFKVHEIWSVDSQEIIKIVATRCQILTLKYTKIDFGWGSAPDPSLQRSPDALAGLKKAYF